MVPLLVQIRGGIIFYENHANRTINANAGDATMLHNAKNDDVVFGRELCLQHQCLYEEVIRGQVCLQTSDFSFSCGINYLLFSTYDIGAIEIDRRQLRGYF